MRFSHSAPRVFLNGCVDFLSGTEKDMFQLPHLGTWGNGEHDFGESCQLEEEGSQGSRN